MRGHEETLAVHRLSGADGAGGVAHSLLRTDPTLIQPDFPLLAPGERGFWLGTDDLGRDLLSRLAVGGQISLLIGLSTAAVAVAAGAVYGIAAALLEGRFNRVDEAMMRLIDVLYSLPGLMIVILFGVFWGRGLPTLVAALALFSWPDTARLIRAQTLALKREEFVEAYRSLGEGSGDWLRGISCRTWQGSSFYR